MMILIALLSIIAQATPMFARHMLFPDLQKPASDNAIARVKGAPGLQLVAWMSEILSDPSFHLEPMHAKTFTFPIEKKVREPEPKLIRLASIFDNPNSNDIQKELVASHLQSSKNFE